MGMNDLMVALDGWLSGGPVATVDKPIDPAQPTIQPCRAIDALRADSFRTKGLEPDQVAQLVKALEHRDRELDDRRSCAECRHHNRGRCSCGSCPFGGSQADVVILHRCRNFSLQGVGHD